MSDTPDPLLDVIARISEGRSVDWEALESRAMTESFRERLAELRIIAGVADLARETPPEANEGQRPGPAPTPTTTEPAWGHLQILEQVGRGAFGEVYRAWDTRLDREVALKLVHTPARNGGDVASDPRIEEGRLLARVRHPNVVTVYGADRLGDTTAIWMEFVRGRTLDQIVRESGALSPDDVVRTGIDVARALSAVHSTGLLHRDIKAPNVVREDSGRIVLMDFGSVVEHDGGSGAHETLAGTPLYLAPEVLQGAQPTVRSDIYALGVLLYHLATGEFPVRARTFDEVRAAVIAGNTVPLTAERTGLSAGLVAVIDRAMRLDPAARFESASAVEAALVTLLPAGARKRWPFAVGGALVVVLLGLVAAWSTASWPFRSDRRTVTARRLLSEAAAWGPLTSDGRYQGCLDMASMNVAVCDLEGGTARAVNADARREAPRESATVQFVVSPSGDRIAYGWSIGPPAGQPRNEIPRTELRVASTADGRFVRLYENGPGLYTVAHDWTGDGRYLLVVVSQRDRPSTLERFDVAAGSREVLLELDQLPMEPRFSPDGRFVTYALLQPQSDRSDIHILDVTRRESSVLVEHPDDDRSAIWTPDGAALVFASDRAGQWGVWRLPVIDGRVDGEPERLHGMGRDLVRPLGFRPDGTLLYWTSTGGLDVHVAPLDLPAGTVGPAARVALNPMVESASPAWSPDGLRIAYLASRSPGTRSRAPYVVVQDAATGVVLMETPSPGRVHQHFLTWVPDGSALLVRAARALHWIDPVTGRSIRQVPDPLLPVTGTFGFSEDNRTLLFLRNRQVMRFDPSSGEHVEIGRINRTGGLANPLSLVLSPDRRSLGLTLVRNEQDGPFRHFVASLDGSDVRQVATTPRRCAVQAWVRDDLILSCHTSPAHSRFDWAATLFAYPVDGGEPTRLGLDMPQLNQVAVHPSGERILFTAGEGNNEIWALENLPPVRRR